MYLYSRILLPWPHECWDYRYVAQRLALHLSACECACGGQRLLSGTALHCSTFPEAASSSMQTAQTQVVLLV